MPLVIVPAGSGRVAIQRPPDGVPELDVLTADREA